MHRPRQIDDPTDWPFLTTQHPVVSRQKSGRLWRRLGVYLPLSFFFLTLFFDYVVIGIDQYFGGPALPGAVSLTWQGAWVGFVAPVLGLVVLVAGISSYRYGTRLLKVSAWRFLTDRRPPVLFLRSFAYDRAEDTSHIAPIFLRRRLEDRLVDVLQSLGPVIAIGRPHEELPETGADRIYVTDADWQAAVRYFTERAVAVVVLAGHSAGLHWEMERVLRELPLDRLLFCFPYLNQTSIANTGWFAAVKWASMQGWERFHDLETERQDRYKAFVQFVASFHQHDLPFPLGDAQYLTFDANGRARLLATQKSVLQQLMFWMVKPYRLLPSSLQPLISHVVIDHALTLKPFVSAVMVSSKT